MSDRLRGEWIRRRVKELPDDTIATSGVGYQDSLPSRFPTIARDLTATVVFVCLSTAVLIGCRKESGVNRAHAAPEARRSTNAEPAPERANERSVEADCTASYRDQVMPGCKDQLEAMNREIVRLYQLAKAGKFMNPERLLEIKANENHWAEDSSHCYLGNDCLSRYSWQVHALRQGYADARSADAQGISQGPVPITCDGFDPGIGATFIRTYPGIAVLQWLNQSVTLIQTTSATPGTKYIGKPIDNDYVFHHHEKRRRFAVQREQIPLCC